MSFGSLSELPTKLAIEFVSINFNATSMRKAVFYILLSPLFWNFFGRLEYHYRIFTKLFNGNNKAANRCFSLVVFLIGAYRDHVYRLAVQDSSLTIEWLPPTFCAAIAGINLKYL